MDLYIFFGDNFIGYMIFLVMFFDKKCLKDFDFYSNYYN